MHLCYRLFFIQLKYREWLTKNKFRTKINGVTEASQNFASIYLFAHPLKLATSNLAYNLDSNKTTLGSKLAGVGARKAS